MGIVFILESVVVSVLTYKSHLYKVLRNILSVYTWCLGQLYVGAYRNQETELQIEEKKDEQP